MAVLFVSGVLTGCAEFPQNMNQVADTLQKMGHGSLTPTTPSKFSQSGLADIFKNTNAEDKWPRVALTIEDMPQYADFPWERWGMGGVTGTPSASRTIPPADFCITVSVVVWKNATTSQQISHIPYCGRDIRENEVSDDFSYQTLGWAQVPKNSSKNTGASRTNGPNPPLKSFPPRSIIIDKNNSQAGLMFAHLLMAMGIDLAVDPLHETRLWVVSTVR